MKLYLIKRKHRESDFDSVDLYIVANDMGQVEKLFLEEHRYAKILSIELISDNVLIQGHEGGVMKLFLIKRDFRFYEDLYIVADSISQTEKLFLEEHIDPKIKSIELISENVIVQGEERNVKT